MLARRGIGSRLVDDAEARAKAAGFNLLTVRSTLNAVPFYR
ncbi:MAG: GNAT family N-acetyltransferase [Dongiaceae bacterium]